MEKTIKINLGSGKDYKEGYINVDNGLMFPDAKVDFVSDIQTFSTLDNSVDEILLSHVVMYLRPEELKPLLIKWRGWLKEGGKIVIETIDLSKVMKIVLENNELDPTKSNDYGLINIFGTTETGPHRWGYTERDLRWQLYKAGFLSNERQQGTKKPERDYILIAIK